MTQLKIKIIETPKALVLVVDMPTDAINAIVDEGHLSVFHKSQHIFHHEIPQGNWQLLGKLSEITEEQWKGIVEDVEPASLGLFPDYNFKPNRLKAVSWCSSATESGLSLIESEVMLKNPLGDKEPEDIPDLGAFTHYQRNKWKQWQAAEDQVFHNPHLFVNY